MIRAIAASAAALLFASSSSAGVLTTKAELEQFKSFANSGQAPYVSRRTQIISDATIQWEWGSATGTPNCTGGSYYLIEAAPDTLAQAAAAILTNDTNQAQSLRNEARGHILDLLDTTYPTAPAGSYQCTLDLSVSLPVWIEAALLLQEQGVFTAADRAAFGDWLKTVYRHPAWASRVRRNNWGTAGSLSAYLIASYVPGNTTLVEVAPGPATISIPTAISDHNALQLVRIRTVTALDSDCTIANGAPANVYGIQSHGGIPDELRRGNNGDLTLCDDDHIAVGDSRLTYQSMHTELLTFHAMALWRLNNPNLTNLFTTDTSAIKRAYDFVIDNPAGDDFPWDPNHSGGLIWAAKYYADADLTTAANALTCNRCGRDMPYMKVFSLFAQPTTSVCP